ncbi:MAG TPA: glycosyltransferase [Pseudonocardiaceae bacterium]
MTADGEYTTSTALLRALRAGGVRYAFANLGSDHAGIIEAYARGRHDGTIDQFPELVICPHESVALSAAHGYAQITGQAQAVIVHVECGTQNLGGMLHNAAKGRVPVLIFAGASPYTQRGELPGSRTEFIQWIQDVPDQRGIVRGYTKYDNEIRTGRNVDQLVGRALQIAHSEPAGPVYLMAAREVLAESLDPTSPPRAGFAPVAPAALAAQVVEHIAGALLEARHPLVINSYLGRHPEAVGRLVQLCELLAIPVLESVPSYVNFPADHPLHVGYQWNTPAQNPTLASADVVLVLGSDVPWIPTRNRPADDARIFVIDADPLKEQMPLWHVPAECFARADLGTALAQLTDRLRTRPLDDAPPVLGFVGRLSVEKNVSLLARVQQELVSQGVTNFRFCIIGQGIKENWLREHLPGAEFPGVLRGEALARAYANMDLFIFPSHTDTFGNVVLEALASGVPAIVTPNGGPSSIIREGETGLIAQDEGFASAAASILMDPALHARMRHKARGYARKTSWDTVFETVYDGYRTIL